MEVEPATMPLIDEASSTTSEGGTDDVRNLMRAIEENGRVADGIAAALARQRVVIQPHEMLTDLFDGTNISDFLRRYDQYMDLLGATERKRKGSLTQFVQKRLQATVRFICDDLDWRTAKRKLKERFRKEDSDQLISAEDRLEELEKRARNLSYEQLGDWLAEHQYYSRRHDSNGWMTSTTRARALYRALDPEIIRETAKAGNVKATVLMTLTYHQLLTAVRETLKELIDFEASLRPQDQRQDGTWVQDDQTTKAAPAKLAPKQKRPAQRPDPMDALTDRMAGLSINMLHPACDEILRRAGLDASTRLWVKQEIIRKATNDNPMVNAIQVEDDQKDDEAFEGPIHDLKVFALRARMPRGDNRCFYCGKPGHFPESCLTLASDRERGIIVYDHDAYLLAIGDDLFRNIVPPVLCTAYIKRGSNIRRLVWHWVNLFQKSKEYDACRTAWAGEEISSEKGMMNEKEMDVLEAWRRLKIDTYDLQLAEVTVMKRPPTTPAVNVLLCDQTVATLAAIKRRRGPDGEGIDAGFDPEAVPQPEEIQDDDTTRGIEEARTRIAEEILSRKITIKARDLCALDPGLARMVGRSWEDMADRIKNTAISKERARDGNPHQDVPTSSTNAVRATDSFSFDEVYRKHAGCFLKHARTITEVETEETDDTEDEDYDKCSNTTSLDSIEGTESEAPIPMINALVNFPSRHIEPEDMDTRQDVPELVIRLDDPNGPRTIALVDSGSEINVITRRVAEENGIFIESTRFGNTNSYSGHKVEINGSATVKVFIANVWITQKVLIIDSPAVGIPCILGMPFIRSARVNFDYTARDGSLRLSCILGSTRMVCHAAGGVRLESKGRRYESQPVKSAST